jgi:hypothetical protein
VEVAGSEHVNVPFFILGTLNPVLVLFVTEEAKSLHTITMGEALTKYEPPNELGDDPLTAKLEIWMSTAPGIRSAEAFMCVGGVQEVHMLAIGVAAFLIQRP